MKISIIDFEHFQYALTLIEIFKGYPVRCFVSNNVYNQIIDYTNNSYFGEKVEFIVIEKRSFKISYNEIVYKLNKEGFSVLFVNPYFDSFRAFYVFIKKFKGDTVLTTHNLNFWFNANFRTPNSFLEFWHRKGAAKKARFIGVEEFLIHHVNQNNFNFFNKDKFLHVPYTLYEPKVIARTNSKKIKIVLPGSIDSNRRSYADTIWCIEEILKVSDDFVFSFAGPPIGEYGQNIIRQLSCIESRFPDSVIFFDRQPLASEYLKEMETASIVLSTSNKTFNCFGTIEFIGQTKPTGILHNMITFSVPGLLPNHLPIPPIFKNSALPYNDKQSLFAEIMKFTNPDYLKQTQINARKCAEAFSVEKIRELIVPLFKN